MKKFTLVLISLFSISELFSKEEKLTVQMVMSSSMRHYPLILKSLQDVEAAKMKIRESYGAFDLKLKAKGDARPRGYYDGKSVDFIIVKPLPYMNSKIYSGYKISDGEYPSYEGKVDTLNGGEIRAGVALSLWQERDIDIRRLKIQLNKLNLSTKELKVLSSQIMVKQTASQAYWKWVAKGNVYRVYEDLLAIALGRQKAINKRVKRGDLAKIYRTENRQYIVKRRSQVIESLRQYKDAALGLSLFLRDEEGNPLLPANNMLPLKIDGEKKITEAEAEKAQEFALQRSPDLFSLDNRIEELKLEEKFGENKLMPRVDLNFEVSRDYGSGLTSLERTENRAFLKLEIPLQRNLGKGKVGKARRERRGVEFKKRLAKEKIQINMRKIFYKLNASVDKIVNTDKEVEYATILQRAEVKKFNSGASDFFVVNIRERNTASAKINNIKARLEYHLSYADYQAATLSFLNN